jgi:hypothetical protein
VSDNLDVPSAQASYAVQYIAEPHQSQHNSELGIEKSSPSFSQFEKANFSAIPVWECVQHRSNCRRCFVQVCRANGRPRKIWLTRHGESEYNRHGKLGGDPPLSALGKEYAKMLPDVVVERTPAVPPSPPPLRPTLPPGCQITSLGSISLKHATIYLALHWHHHHSRPLTNLQPPTKPRLGEREVKFKIQEPVRLLTNASWTTSLLYLFASIQAHQAGQRPRGLATTWLSPPNTIYRTC